MKVSQSSTLKLLVIAFIRKQFFNYRNQNFDIFQAWPTNPMLWFHCRLYSRKGFCIFIFYFFFRFKQISVHRTKNYFPLCPEAYFPFVSSLKNYCAEITFSFQLIFAEGNFYNFSHFLVLWWQGITIYLYLRFTCLEHRSQGFLSAQIVLPQIIFQKPPQPQRSSEN